MSRVHLTRRRSFLTGVVAALAVVFLGRLVLNETSIADWIVAPLLVVEQPELPHADAAVVLGAGVVQGCAPNINGVRRVIRAVRLWRDGRAPMLLFTGGTGGDCPVAVAMASLAQELGVPADRVRVEVTSTSTWENAVVSAPLLRGWGMTRVLLVTDRLHMRRAAAVFARAGLVVEPVSVPIYEGHEDNVSMLLAGLREFAALAVYRARGRLGEPGAVQAAAGQPALETTIRMTISNPTGPIVVLGASYAQGWPLEQVAGVRVINRGEEGQQSFELAERFDRDVVSASPRAVVLWGFINDIFRAPPGGEMDQVLSVIRDSYTRMIAMARQHGIEPVLATEVTARPRAMLVMDTLAGWAGALRGKEAYQDGVNRHVMAVNQWIVSLGAREDLLVLDFQSVLSEPGGRRHRPFAQPDGSHITTAGYRALTTYATPLLEEHLVGR